MFTMRTAKGSPYKLYCQTRADNIRPYRCVNGDCRFAKTERACECRRGKEAYASCGKRLIIYKPPCANGDMTFHPNVSPQRDATWKRGVCFMRDTIDYMKTTVCERRHDLPHERKPPKGRPVEKRRMPLAILLTMWYNVHCTKK